VICLSGNLVGLIATDENEKAPDRIRGFCLADASRTVYSGLPMSTFSVPTPSTPHSILSPG
jgi:hypothetical protein